jgi:RNA polymerase sigma factor (sigma-70 family)
MGIDEELMSACAQGDDEAFATLYGRHRNGLVARFRRQWRCHHDAEDLAQQVFLNLHRFRADYRAGAPFRPWLVTIARNLLRDRVRQVGRGRETCVESDVLASLESVPPPDHEGRRALHRALHALAPAQRGIVERHWFEGAPFEEIAAELGITSMAARLRAHRAYAELRAQLAPSAPKTRPAAVRSIVQLRPRSDAELPTPWVA